ncbi:hypothetical protein OS493_009753 [Desmophyllum pertusum]|uniref:Major facilitator superfamily associated domain-containing protein n=1 Tax=Desmophyllum pertusum TaxID=174260 RepID=A0A9X0CN69_9CNID|nr:hypothetical protein OS493_009753 [Desmophyllum pertusum]
MASEGDETRFVNGKMEGQTRIRMRNQFNPRRFCRINKNLLILKLYYFFAFSGQACIRPFYAVFFRHLGMSAQQTGIIFGLQPLGRFLGAPICGALADKYRKHRLVMLVMFIVSTSLQFSLVFVRPNEDPRIHLRVRKKMPPVTMVTCGRVMFQENCTLFSVDRNCRNHSVFNMLANTAGNGRNNNNTFLLLAILVFVSSLFDNANTLADAAAVKYLTDIDRGGDYGKQRMWGAVGWGSIAILSGFAIDQSSQHSHQSQFFVAFCGFLSFSIAAIITVFKLPLEFLEGKSNPKIFQSVLSILLDCRIITFLFVILIMGTCMSTIGAFLFWFLEDMNGSHLLMDSPSV